MCTGLSLYHPTIAVLNLVKVRPEHCPPSLNPTPFSLHTGIPLSIIVKDFGWGAYFTTLATCCGLALLLLSPMTNLRSAVQRAENRKARLALEEKKRA